MKFKITAFLLAPKSPMRDPPFIGKDLQMEGQTHSILPFLFSETTVAGEFSELNSGDGIILHDVQ